MKKATVGFFVPGNLRFSHILLCFFVKQWAKIAALRRKAKTAGVSTKCKMHLRHPHNITSLRSVIGQSIKPTRSHSFSKTICSPVIG